MHELAQMIADTSDDIMESVDDPIALSHAEMLRGVADMVNNWYEILESAAASPERLANDFAALHVSLAKLISMLVITTAAAPRLPESNHNTKMLMAAIIHEVGEFANSSVLPSNEDLQSIALAKAESGTMN